MRYAVLSDVHSNLEALEAVLDALSRDSIDRVVVLGDFVGYYASPNQCLELLRRRRVEAVAGNHDLVAVGKAEADRFSQRAKQAIEWTKGRLEVSHVEYLRGLPEQAIVDGRFVICHGSLRSPHQYVRTPAEALQVLRDLRERDAALRLCFFGHTHRPVVYSWSGEEAPAVEATREGGLELRGGRWYAINPGSVGQSRDGDPRASFLTYDAEAGAIRFHRVEYDYRACRRKTLAAGLPADGGRRLRIVRKVLGVLNGARLPLLGLLRGLPVVRARRRPDGPPARLEPELLGALVQDVARRLGGPLEVTDQRASQTGCHIVWMRGREPYVGKVTSRETAATRLRANVRAVAAARTASHGDGNVTARIPRVLLTGEVLGRFYSIETCLPGRAATGFLGSPPTAEEITGHAAIFLMAFHRASRRDSVMDLSRWHETVSPAVEQVEPLAGSGGLSAEYAAVTSEVQARLLGRAVPVVFAHGNFWAGNLLWEPDRGLTGVVDWDGAAESGLPLVDLLYFLVRADSLGRRVSLGEAVVEWMKEGTRPALENRWVEPYCRAVSVPADLLGPLFYICWLQQVHLHTRYGSRAVANPVWLRKNVLDVVEAAAKFL